MSPSVQESKNGRFGSHPDGRRPTARPLQESHRLHRGRPSFGRVPAAVDVSADGRPGDTSPTKSRLTETLNPSGPFPNQSARGPTPLVAAILRALETIQPGQIQIPSGRDVLRIAPRWEIGLRRASTPNAAHRHAPARVPTRHRRPKPATLAN